jgi:hypothetical protein
VQAIIETFPEAKLVARRDRKPEPAPDYLPDDAVSDANANEGADER